MFSRYSAASLATRSVRRRNSSAEISTEFIARSISALGEHVVLGSRHRGRALLLTPKNLIQLRGAGSVGAREIHSGGDLCTWRFPLINFVDQAIFQVAIVSLVNRLIAR